MCHDKLFVMNSTPLLNSLCVCVSVCVCVCGSGITHVVGKCFPYKDKNTQKRIDLDKNTVQVNACCKVGEG